jgi:hypothetical protein
MTIPQISEVLRVSQYLAVNDLKRQPLIGHMSKPNLPRLLYMVRKNLDYMYDLDSSYSSLTRVANYASSLCGQFGLQAQAIIALGIAGTVVSATTASNFGVGYIHVTQDDFTGATDYENAALDGINFRVYANWIPRYLDAGIDYDVLPGGGFRMLISGFDATTNDYEFYVDAQGGISSSGSVAVTGQGLTYDLSAPTGIPNIASGTPYEERTVVVIPNGFAYTWGNTFVFTFDNPEQPTAIDDNTAQIYKFQYISGLGWVCIGQSLDVPN